MTVEFAPTKLGPGTATLIVSGSPGGTVSTALSGTGLPPPEISSPISSYTFPAQETFTDRGTQIEIDNVGGSPTDRLHATLTGSQAAMFRADDSSCVNVAAGSRCYVLVEFDPTEVGQANATLVVESALAGTVTVALAATATPGTSITVSRDAYPTAGLEPRLLYFAPQKARISNPLHRRNARKTICYLAAP